MGIFSKKKKIYGLKPKGLRSKESVKTDYLTLASELGGITYQIETLKQESQRLQATMSKLNLEAYEIEQEDAKNPQKEETTDGK